MISLENIRSFCALVETGSFQEAAHQLNKSQPAISQQLKSIEALLGQVVYDRKSSGPTPAGAVLYERGRRLVALAVDVERSVMDFDESLGGELRVGASDTNALYFLPKPVKRFAAKMPQVRLTIRTRSTDEVARDVARGVLDLAIVTLPVSAAGLQTKELYRQQLVLVVPKKHPLATRNRTSMTVLEEHPFVLLDEDTRTGTLLRRFFRANDFEPRVVLESGSFEVIKRYVAEGLGLSFLPESAVEPVDRRQLMTLRVPDLPQIPIGVVWSKEAYQTKAASTFLAMLGSE